MSNPQLVQASVKAAVKVVGLLLSGGVIYFLGNQQGKISERKIHRGVYTENENLRSEIDKILGTFVTSSHNHKTIIAEIFKSKPASEKQLVLILKKYGLEDAEIDMVFKMLADNEFFSEAKTV